MPALLPQPDPDGLLEYSVVYTDRALNHMSQRFQGVMRDLSRILKQVYHAEASVIVPGSGTFGMEAVARQFATGKNVLVLRNGWFSYRWTQILEVGAIPARCTVLKARAQHSGPKAAFAPAPLPEVLATIAQERPAVVFAPHVETASGMILPDDYVRAVGEAVRAVGGLFVLDCIASGTVWVDMQALAVDVVISAPQKGWSGPPCAALIALGARAVAQLAQTQSSSFACDLKQWRAIMQACEEGRHAYYTTMPTDALAKVRDIMLETENYGFAKVAQEQLQLGTRVRALLAQQGYVSVAAAGFEAPGVVVCYTDDDGVHNSKKFAAVGLQTAAGVPLMCDEPSAYKSFRLGLFGLDKLHNIDRTVAHLAQALGAIAAA